MKQQLEKLYWEHAQHWLSDEEFDTEISRIARKYGVEFEAAMKVYTDEVYPEQSNP